MKVLHVLAGTDPRHGGPSEAVWHMCREAIAGGHQVSVLAGDDGRGPEASSDVPADLRDRVSVRYVRTRWPMRYRNNLGLLRVLPRAMRSADLIHVHSLYLMHTAAVFLMSRWIRVPVVIRPHGSLGPETRQAWHVVQRLHYQLVDRPFLERAAAIHVTSDRELRDVTAIGLTSRAVVAPIRLWSVTDRGGDEGTGGSGSELLFLGRFDDKKRPRLCIEALATLHRWGHTDFRLRMAGPSGHETPESLAALAEQSDVGSSVTVGGPVYGANKHEFLRGPGIFLLVSKHENFGVAVAEALSYGHPAVLSSEVAIAPYLEAQGVAVIVDPTPGAVAMGILALAEPSCYARASEHAPEALKSLWEDGLGILDLYDLAVMS